MTSAAANSRTGPVSASSSDSTAGAIAVAPPSKPTVGAIPVAPPSKPTVGAIPVAASEYPTVGAIPVAASDAYPTVGAIPVAASDSSSTTTFWTPESSNDRRNSPTRSGSDHDSRVASSRWLSSANKRSVPTTVSVNVLMGLSARSMTD